MSNLRKLRRNLIPYRIKTAKALSAMVATAGSFEVMRENFPATFEKTFTQQVKEVFEIPKEGGEPTNEGKTS